MTGVDGVHGGFNINNSNEEDEEEAKRRKPDEASMNFLLGKKLNKGMKLILVQKTRARLRRTWGLPQ